jgi:hypothetical protein
MRHLLHGAVRPAGDDYPQRVTWPSLRARRAAQRGDCDKSCR